jgi:hypothetical protein
MPNEPTTTGYQRAEQQPVDSVVQTRPGDQAARRGMSNSGSGNRLLSSVLLGFTAVFIGVVVVFLLAIGLNGLIRAYNGGSHPASGVSATPPVPSPVVGRLTMRTNHDYNVDARAGQYLAPRIRGASVGEVSATAKGLVLADADALPLPTPASSTYQACIALNWTGPTPVRWGSAAPSTIPWSQLSRGARICFRTTRGGIFVGLLTVTRPWSKGHITFDVRSWGCLARPHETATC